MDMPPIIGNEGFASLKEDTVESAEGYAEILVGVLRYDTEQRALLARVEQLEREIAALKAPASADTKPSPTIVTVPLHREPAVSVTEQPIPIYPMPTSAEIDELIGVVGRCYPALLDTSVGFEGDPHARRAQWLKQFEAAFEAIGCMRRMDRPSTKYYLSAHIKLAETILKGFGRPSMTIRGNPFIAAVLAHYDVPISGIGRHHEGVQIEIGLHQYVGRPAGDAWRRILEGQAPREVGVQRIVPPPSPARVYGQGY